VDPDAEKLVARAQVELPYGTAAFERLAAQCYPRLRRLAHAITGNPDDADTVAQDTMIRVFHGLPGLRDPATFDAWLQRTLVNVARTHMAAERRQREKAEAWGDAAASDVEDRSEARGVPPAKPSFGALVEGLGLRERTILAFRLVEELDYPSIARIMDMGESAVKMAYRRAVERLRRRHHNLR